MNEMDLQNSRRALAAASNSLREVGISRVWIEQGGGGVAFLVEAETYDPDAFDPPPAVVTALQRALSSLHLPHWYARDGSYKSEMPITIRVSAPMASTSHSVHSMVWPPSQIVEAIERDLAQRSEYTERQAKAFAELLRLEQSGGACSRRDAEPPSPPDK